MASTLNEALRCYGHCNSSRGWCPSSTTAATIPFRGISRRHPRAGLALQVSALNSTDEEQQDTRPSTPPLPNTSASQVSSSGSSGLSKVIAGGAISLGVAAFLFTRLATGTVSLSTLEKAAVPLDAALSNQRPTMVEFYAGWCEVCRELAADVYQVEQDYKDMINFVMLNVENPKWAPEVSEYRVGGIPHFVFLDGQGRAQAAAVGRLPRQVLDGNLKALAAGADLPFRTATGVTSSLSGAGPASMMGPPASREVTPRGHS